MPLRNLSLLLITILFSMICYAKAARNRYASIIAEGMMIVSEMALEETDRRALFENAMTGMLKSLDENSQYLPPELYSPLQESLLQQFGGIGILLDPSAERLTILSVLVDTPAHRAGLRPGDVILEIEGKSTEGLDFEDAPDLLRGEPGSTVQLRVRHADDQLEHVVEITREVIYVPYVLGDWRDEQGHWRFFLESDPRIGYIRIENFGERTPDELDKALSSIAGQVDGLIIDLRFNAGGLLRSAVECCDMFLDEGVIVTIRGRDRKIRDRYSASSPLLCPSDWPVAVITNGQSASASEIMAACLQDHGRAVVVGERTYGKGTVQNIYPLEGGRSGLKLTVASYWRPSGKDIHRKEGADEDDDWGVRPNPGMEVDVSDEQAIKVFQQRRRRDILDGSPTSIESSVEDTIKDEQLQRAIDYVRSRLQ